MKHMFFSDFLGNEQVKEQLSSYLERGKFPHAFLFEGPKGIGKRHLAKLFAKAIFCKEKDVYLRPCGKCNSCIKAQSGNHPDIREEGGDGSARSFHIDVIRDIRDNIYTKPNESEYSIIILENAQGMTHQAQNAILKIIEEPPSHGIFIITCESRLQLLETIVSRTFHFPLSGVSNEGVPVVAKKAEVNEKEAKEALELFSGNIGQAIDGLKDGEFKKTVDLLPSFALAVSSNNDMDLLKLTGELENDKQLSDGLINALVLVFRDVLVLRNGGKEMISIAPDIAKQISMKMSDKNIIKVLEVLESLKEARLKNMNYNLFITLFVSRLRTDAKG